MPQVMLFPDVSRRPVLRLFRFLTLATCCSHGLAASLAVLLNLTAALAGPGAAAQEPAPASERRAEMRLARFVAAEGTDIKALEPLLARVIATADIGDQVDADDDERVLRRIRNSAIDVLATEGYFNPKVTVSVGSDGSSRYLLVLDPGRRTRVSNVEVTLVGAIEKQPVRLGELLATWELDVGQPFRDPAWASAKAKLLARVQERDYPAARLVESNADIDVDEGTARLRVQIDSGPAFTLGEIEIVAEEGKGLVRYSRTLVERFNDIKPGDRYDSVRLLELQRRLQGGPYFSTVLVEVPYDPAKPDNVPIRITLTEAKSKRLSAGLGYSTNTGPRIEGMYRHVGLFGLPYTLQTGIGYDKTRTIGFADILLPPKPNGAVDSFGVLGERTDIQNLITQRAAIGAARAWATDPQAHEKGFSYENRFSLKLQRETTQEVQQVGAPPTEKFTNDTLSAAYSWTRRTVDSITNPRRGDVLTLVGAGGISRTGLSTLLSQSFVYGYGRYVRYFPIADRHQLIMRGELGHVASDDLRYVPIDYRFRAGGAGSVRGYPYQSLGVRAGDSVVGANSLAIISSEYVHWLTPTWGAAAFVDVGDADNNIAKVNWARGYGVGPRWRTLAGPLALDLAYGERDRRWRIHFTIAISF